MLQHQPHLAQALFAATIWFLFAIFVLTVNLTTGPLKPYEFKVSQLKQLMPRGNYRKNFVMLLQLIQDRALAFVFLKSLVAAFIASEFEDGFTELQLILLWFVVILMISSLGAVTHFRTDRVARDPGATTVQHIRVASLQLIVIALSGSLLAFVLHLTVPHGPEALVTGLLLGQDLITTLLTSVKVSIDHVLAIQCSVPGDQVEQYTHMRTVNDFLWTVVLQLCTLGHYCLLLLLHGLTFSILQVVLFFNARAVFVKLFSSAKKFRTYLARRSALQQHLRPAAQADMGEGGSTDCSICFEDVPVVDGVVLQCGHVFHGACVRRWLASPDSHGRCPVCRAEAVPGLATPPPEQGQAAPAVNTQQFNLGPFQLQFGGGPVGGVGGMFRFGGAAQAGVGAAPQPAGAPPPMAQAHPPLFGGAAVSEASVTAVLEVLPHLDPRSVRATLSRLGSDVNAVVALGLEGGIPTAPPTPPPPVAARHDDIPPPQPAVGGVGSPAAPAPQAAPAPGPQNSTPAVTADDEDEIVFFDGCSSDEEEILRDSAQIVSQARSGKAEPWVVFEAQKNALHMQCLRMYLKRSRARARSTHRQRGSKGGASCHSPQAEAETAHSDETSGRMHAALDGVVASAASGGGQAAGEGGGEAAGAQSQRGAESSAVESPMPAGGILDDEQLGVLSPAALRRRQMALAAERRICGAT